MKCRTRSRACRTAAPAAVLLLGGVSLPPFAGAPGVNGTVVETETIGAASWGATASVTSMTFTSDAVRTTDVTNTGTVALVAESYLVTVSKTASGTPTFKVFTCAVAWVSTKCTGGAGTQAGATLPANSSTTVTVTAADPVGTITYLQIEPAMVWVSTVVTISPRITSPGQVRAAVATNQ